MGKTREKPQGGRPREKAICPRGKIIEDRLARLHMSVEGVSDLTGIAPPTIYAIISGDTADPRASTLIKLADVLDLPIATLVAAKSR